MTIRAVCHGLWRGGPDTNICNAHTNSPGSLSEVCLQYLLSIHSLPQFYSILTPLAFKHIHAHFIFDGVKAISCSQGPSTIHFLHQALWPLLICVASIKPPRSSLRSDYSAKTVPSWPYPWPSSIWPATSIFICVSSFFQTFNILHFSVLWWTPLFHLTLSLKMRMTFLLHQASSQQRLAHLRAGKLSADVAP